MGSYTREQKELMRLFKCVIDTGTEVLFAFFDLKVLSKTKYGGNFNKLLKLETHFFYHQWEPKKTMCCACPNTGCSIKRISKMEPWIFKKLYDTSGIEDTTHVIKHGGCIQQLCLHKYVAKDIAAQELDISVFSFLLRVMAYTCMTASQKSSLESVCLCRSSICHAWSTKCFQLTELNKLWIDLETHLINLSEVRYQRIIKLQIQNSRKLEIDSGEVAELSKQITNVQEVSY
ncbi:unnamed protein product [Mytilus coruscus]|uniref:DZIP3-like HEPN domain-containing protein n=1 Tax=Mytilus coruscus TaxID=42192 RepID=A0A6J8E5K0_MYTCO|nr:unnamed protein product [Mytilus coruscus]